MSVNSSSNAALPPSSSSSHLLQDAFPAELFELHPWTRQHHRHDPHQHPPPLPRRRSKMAAASHSGVLT
ncbi:uncharacterized protein V6R79_024349 [Siganus canaliculatus]